MTLVLSLCGFAKLTEHKRSYELEIRMQWPSIPLFKDKERQDNVKYVLLNARYIESIEKNCMSTYSSASLTNVHKYDVQGKEPEVTVRCYMPRSELEKIYEKRKEKVQDMVYIAEEAQQKAKVDMALQYYY